MSTSRGRRALILSVIVAVAGFLALTGCSSSGGSSAPGNDAKQPAPRVSLPGDADNAAALDPAALCKSIKQSDAQALMVPKVSTPQAAPTGCGFVRPGEDANGDNLTVSINPIDNDKRSYNNLRSGALKSKSYPLSGIGDEAYWDWPVQGQSGPDLSAHKGSTTCVVQLPADLTPVRITKSGRAPIYQVSQASAAAFATRMGVLCNDVFAAHH